MNIEQEKSLRIEIDRAEIDRRRARADRHPFSDAEEDQFDLDTTSLLKEGNDYTNMCLNCASANTLFWHLIDASRLQAQHAMMTASTFEGCTLEQCNFGHANLDYARFRGCNLTGSIFTAASMNKVDCKAANMTSTFLQTLSCRKASFYAATLSHADLSGSTMEESDFNWGTMEYTNFSGVRLDHCQFEDANLRHANFRYANLRHASFKFADITGANLTHANLFGTIFTHKEQLLTANLKEIKASFMKIFIDSTLTQLDTYQRSLIALQNLDFFQNFRLVSLTHEDDQWMLLTKFLYGCVVLSTTPVREVLMDWVDTIIQVKQKGAIL